MPLAYLKNKKKVMHSSML